MSNDIDTEKRVYLFIFFAFLEVERGEMRTVCKQSFYVRYLPRSKLNLSSL